MPVATVSVTLLNEFVTPTIEFLTREEVPYAVIDMVQWPMKGDEPSSWITLEKPAPISLGLVVKA